MFLSEIYKAWIVYVEFPGWCVVASMGVREFQGKSADAWLGNIVSMVKKKYDKKERNAEPGAEAHLSGEKCISESRCF